MNIYNHMDILYNDGIIFNDEHLITALVAKYKINVKILPKSQFYIDLSRCDS